MTRTRQVVAGASMIHYPLWASALLVRLVAAVSALAVPAILSCGDSTDDPAPSPTARSLLFANPYPTSPYPTTTPYPTSTPYPVAVRNVEWLEIS